MPAKKKPRGSPKGLKPFKPGQSGNPKGSSARSRALAKLKTMNAAELATVGSDLLRGDRKDLQAVGQDPKASVVQLALARLLMVVLQEGDARTLDVVLSRVVGKPKETLEVSGKDGEAVQLDVATRQQTAQEKAARADALAAQRALVGDD